MTQLINESKGTLIHNDIVLNPGEIKEIDAKIAKIWLQIDGVKEYINPQDAKEQEQILLKKIDALKAENAKLKAENAKLKKKIK